MNYKIFIVNKIMENTCFFNNVFCIPHGDKYIIYLPLRGAILLGNDTFVNLLYQAGSGNKEALTKLDIDELSITNFFKSEKQLTHLTCPNNNSLFAPTSVSLFLTNDCTLRCRYCYAEGGHNKHQISWDMITGIIDEILANVHSTKSNRIIINFHGGGDVSAAWTLLVRTREYLNSLVESYNIDIMTSVGLNGILNSKQQRWIIKNIDSATISIDGPPDIQNNQRPFPNGEPSFPYVDETLKTFDAANYPYAIRTTVTSDSVLHLEEIISFFCENYKAKKIKFEPMYPRGRALKSKLQSPDAVIFVEQFRKARKIAKDARRDLIYSGARLKVVTNVFCQAAGNSCAITPEGWITSCYEVLSPSDPLSEIFFYGHYDHKSKKLKIDEERRKRLFQLSVLNKPFCAKCFCKWHCAGDCPVKSIHAERTQDQNLPDRCYINRELTKDQLIEALNNCE